MKCRHLPDLIAYLDNELEVEKLNKFEEHLASCPVCQAEKARQKQLSNSLKLISQLEPPKDLAAKVMTKINLKSKELETKNQLWGWWILPVSIFLILINSFIAFKLIKLTPTAFIQLIQPVEKLITTFNLFVFSILKLILIISSILLKLIASGINWWLPVKWLFLALLALQLVVLIPNLQNKKVT
jgi:hypothetical protein